MIEAHGLNELILDLAKAGPTLGLRLPKAMDRTGQELRDKARERAPKSRSWPHYANSITHEVTEGGRAVEVGPEKGGQGSLGHIIEYGRAAHGPIKPHLSPALDAHVEDFERAMELLAAGLFR